MKPIHVLKTQIDNNKKLIVDLCVVAVDLFCFSWLENASITQSTSCGFLYVFVFRFGCQYMYIVYTYSFCMDRGIFGVWIIQMKNEHSNRIDIQLELQNSMKNDVDTKK